MIIWGSTSIRYNTWGMRLNAAKCHRPVTLNFSLTGQVLEEVMDAKYSGVTLSLKLRHWLYLDQIFFKISVHPFRTIP